MKKKTPKEMADTTNKVKNTLEGINSRLNDTKEWIRELEERELKITAAEQNIEKRMERPKRPLGQHQVHQHSHNRGLRRRRERERT